MPSLTVEIYVASFIPLVAIVVSHVLGQRQGEKRADHVRVELAEKIDMLNHRITEARDTLNGRMTELHDTLNGRMTELHDTLNDRINETRSEMLSRIAESKADLAGRITELSARTDAQFIQVRGEIVQSAAGVKELVLAESRASRAEILAALSARSRSAGADH